LNLNKVELLLLSEQLFESLPVKANDNLVTNNNDWSSHRAKSFKLFDCQGVFSYVLLFKNKASLRKELLRLAAEQSARLAIDSNFSRHGFHFLSFIIIRIMKYIPNGQASTAPRVSNPLAIAPTDRPKSEIAATRSSGAPQHIAIPSGPVSRPFLSSGHAGPSAVVIFAASVFSFSET
jgi:hypothetical protein